MLKLLREHVSELWTEGIHNEKELDASTFEVLLI